MTEYDARVVFTSLQNTLNSREMVRDAFAFWRRKMANLEFDAVQITEQLDSYLGLGSAERKNLMVSLFANANRSLSELSEIPEYVGDGSADAGSGSTEASVPKPSGAVKDVSIRLVEMFFSGCIEVMDERQSRERDEVVRELEQKGLNIKNRQVNSAIQKGARGVPNLPADLSEADCKELMHEHYLLFCDVIGPVETDLVYQTTMSSLLKMEIAREYDPRKLLP
jgi:hypothetical protein